MAAVAAPRWPAGTLGTLLLVMGGFALVFAAAAVTLHQPIAVELGEKIILDLSQVAASVAANGRVLGCGGPG